MAKPADRTIVSLAELRFKPANSNDAARAVLAHHFVNVPRCSFARDDGISNYLGAETGIGIFPVSPDAGRADKADVPAIEGETAAASGNRRRKLLRAGFALSVLLHAVAAIAIGVATLALPDDAALEEGVMSITLVVEGNADNAHAAGAEEEVKEPENKPVETEIKPVETPTSVEQPVPATAETILKDVPMPMLGADLPEILSSKVAAEVKVEAPAKQQPIEEKPEPRIETQTAVIAEEQIEPRPVEKKREDKPKPVEKQPEARKEEPKKQPEKKEKPEKKDKPQEKPRQNKGDQASTANKGDVDSDRRGASSTHSRGDSGNRDIGNAARSNYKGLVQKKLQRAKGRAHNPGKGKVTVTFTIAADGSVAGLTVGRSSGKDAVDAAALKIVRSASPFPAIPTDTGKKSWKMSVPIDFK